MEEIKDSLNIALEIINTLLQNKEIKKWNNIYKSQTIDDNINIILKKGHFEINYKNKKDILKTDILKKLKKISTDVDKIID